MTRDDQHWWPVAVAVAFGLLLSSHSGIHELSRKSRASYRSAQTQTMTALAVKSPGSKQRLRMSARFHPHFAQNLVAPTGQILS